MRYVYDFDEEAPGGRELLGGKGVGLAEMTALGVPVPAGFTITTDACRAYIAAGKRVPDGLDDEVGAHIAALEERSGKRFGDPSDPLLMSVRSGAAISMPGMMDTILNLGLNDVAVEGQAASTGNPRFAYDSYRRLIQMYGEVVDGVDGQRFEGAIADLKAARGVANDLELDADDLRELIATFQQIYEEEVGSGFPQDPREQLRRAYRAVFDSWDAPRAQVYRRTYEIPDDIGTAVNVVQMVFGNKGESSSTGVCFTRDPSTGESVLYGEFLVNAQGEDVVAGIRTPGADRGDARAACPRRTTQLTATLDRLEAHYRDMQDIEFTVEEGTLYILQTRTGKRTATAALRIAVEMAEEGLISREEAVARIDPGQLDQLLHPMIDPASPVEVAAQGLNASPGAASGEIVLDADTAEERGKAGDDVILVRWETTPDDIHGLIQARGVLTAHGGMTSHAAVVARGMGKPCVAGCEGLSIDARAGTVTIGEHTLNVGDVITIDGGTGRVIVGPVRLVPPAIDENFGTILDWADELRRLRVRANADTPEDAAKAREFGAEGIGLCRTEHMFMAQDRLPIVQEMIMARDEAARRVALDKLLPMQQSDFEGIFEAMAGFPVTIRLLDPPLHEFLPTLEEATSDDDAPADRGAARGQPDARHAWLPARAAVAGDLRDAGARDRAGSRSGRGADGRAAARRDHAPARRLPRGARAPARADRARRGRGAVGRVPVRHDDRAAACLHPGRRDRRGGRLLLVRHERPHPDGDRLLARRRRGQVPHLLPRARDPRAQPVRGARPGGRRRPDADRRRARPQHEAGPEDGDLRRARRRAALGRVLPPARARLRQLLALPGAARTARSRPGGAGRRGRRPRSRSAAER